ncbi:MAG: hypothetical protein AAGG09_03800 [Pseudomonadota bacterium]
MRPSILALVAIGPFLTAACSGASFDPHSNPDIFTARLENNVVSGTYNPAGFNAQSVQNQIDNICVDAELGRYVEAPTADGLVSFTASCASGPKLSRALLSVERESDDRFVSRIIGS